MGTNNFDAVSQLHFWIHLCIPSDLISGYTHTAALDHRFAINTRWQWTRRAMFALELSEDQQETLKTFRVVALPLTSMMIENRIGVIRCNKEILHTVDAFYDNSKI